MQLDIAAINGGFPEGVWLNAVFRFLLERRHLTVVFQKDDDFLLTKVHLKGTRAIVTATQLCLGGGIPCPWLEISSSKSAASHSAEG
jgi:hypothetical protein